MDETEFRIEFSINRRQPGEEDFTEIGFGSSGEWSSLDQCTHMVDSAVTNFEWETEGDQPSPEDVRRAAQRADMDAEYDDTNRAGW